VLQNAREGVIEAECSSAFEHERGALKDLVESWRRKPARKVRPHVTVDTSSAGGSRSLSANKVTTVRRAQLAALETAVNA